MTPDWIDEYVEDYNQRVYAGLMNGRAKSLLREMKMKEHEFWEREAEDYVYGQDEGEPPQGAKW